MKINNPLWEYMILDADLKCANVNSFAMADIDGCGQDELLAGGDGCLLWYDLKTGCKWTVAKGNFSVGLLAGDLDGDGRLELAVAELDPSASANWMISVFKPGHDISALWGRTIIDSHCSGLAHDLLYEDIDGDGEKELVADAVFSSPSGIYFYKRTASGRWDKFIVVEKINTEGLSIGDLDGDGSVEIVSGPDIYKIPQAGPYCGRWTGLSTPQICGSSAARR